MAASKSFEDGPAPPFSKDVVSEIRKRNPMVFLTCFRDKNHNVIVYEAMVKDGKFMNPPIVGYWLILEPSYQEARKKRGIHHDREEFGFLDDKFAWGFTTKRISDTEATFSFKSHPHPLTVRLSKNKTEAHMFADYKGRKYMLQQMYVRASENIKLLNLADNVKSIQFKGFDVSSQPYQPAQVYFKGGPD